MKKAILIFSISLIFATSIFADIAPPKEATPKPTPKTKAAKEIDTYLNIRMSENYKEAKLVIPRKQLKQLRAELEELDSGADHNAAVTGSGFKNTQTVIAGIFLSLAFVFGGVWMFRSKAAKNTKIAGTLLLISLSGAAASYVYANAGPPPSVRSVTSKMFAKEMGYYNFGGGRVKLVVSDTEENPELQVPLVKEEVKPNEE